MQMMLWAPAQLAPYWQWEDYAAGMFKITDKSDFDRMLAMSIEILSTPAVCIESMQRVIHEWKVSSLQNFHDSTINRRPWLGRACCCIACGARDDVVRVAWWKITDEQRQSANDIADAVIAQWELIYA